MTGAARYSPELRDGAIAGGRCADCAATTAPATPRCPRCGGPVELAVFAARGTVWGATVVHVAVGARQPPFGLAYVDLEDGPRILVHTAPTPLPVGSAVLVVDGEDGELTAAPR